MLTNYIHNYSLEYVNAFFRNKFQHVGKKKNYKIIITRIN